MKKTILIFGGLAFVINILLGLLLSKYSNFNMGVNCGVIALNTALLYALYQFNMRDAFRISLSFLFGIVGVIELLLACFMPQYAQDNGSLIAIILILFTKILILTITNNSSNKKNGKYELSKR